MDDTISEVRQRVLSQFGQQKMEKGENGPRERTVRGRGDGEIDDAPDGCCDVGRTGNAEVGGGRDGVENAAVSSRDETENTEVFSSGREEA